VGLDVWFRDDVERIIAAIAIAGEGPLRTIQSRDALFYYRLGYGKALEAFAAGFGIRYRPTCLLIEDSARDVEER
jgi:hypothetical protein